MSSSSHPNRIEAADDLPERLQTALATPLPPRVCRRARERFAPELCYGRHFGQRTHATRNAAVACLLYPCDDGWTIPLTLRPATMKDHAGQVSFPGGRLEAGESYEQAAIRELNEELAVPPEEVRVIGRLSEIYVFVSDFIVVPIVLAAKQRSNFHLCEQEVEELIELPVSVLRDPECHRHHVRSMSLGSSVPGATFASYRCPHIEFGKHPIWGATAVMLGELMEFLDRA